MAMPPLTIGKITAPVPIIQGGMAVRVSLAPLAGAVAKERGIGIIAGTGLSPEEMTEQVRQAREIAPDGIIGVNVLVAYRHFAEVIQAAIAAGVDLVIAGAGFSRDVFQWTREAGVEMVPVVSSARVAKLAEKFGASAVVCEGVEAGGHLGTDRSVRDALPEIVEAVSIPVLAAGNIVNGADIFEMMSMGAAGVQMGTRFCDTVECSVADEFKRMHLDATDEDVVLIASPVGLPGRAIRNEFTRELERGSVERIVKCISCLKHCGKQYCIMERLIMAAEGDVVNGLVFSGSSASRITDLPTVPELIARLQREYDEAAAAVGAAS